MAQEFLICSASKFDVPGIISAVLANQDDLSLFQRSERDVARHLKDFIVAKDSEGDVIGCAALHRDSSELAEVLSVAVLPDLQGRRIGERLIRACSQRAKADGIKYLWLATMKPGYFARFGFEPISRWQLPSSVLMNKLKQVFRQSPDRWLPALVGKQTFMRYELKRAGD